MRYYFPQSTNKAAIDIPTVLNTYHTIIEVEKKWRYLV